MKIFENPLYISDVNYVAKLDLPWEKLRNKAIMISGATGMIGSMLVDVIMKKNENGLNCMIYALGRNKSRMQSRFKYCYRNPLFKYIEYNVNKELNFEEVDTVDYILHLASNTHPMQYSTDPIGTITTNIIGVQNLLKLLVLLLPHLMRFMVKTVAMLKNLMKSIVAILIAIQ